MTKSKPYLLGVVLLLAALSTWIFGILGTRSIDYRLPKDSNLVLNRTSVEYSQTKIPRIKVEQSTTNTLRILENQNAAQPKFGVITVRDSIFQTIVTKARVSVIIGDELVVNEYTNDQGQVSIGNYNSRTARIRIQALGYRDLYQIIDLTREVTVYIVKVQTVQISITWQGSNRILYGILRIFSDKRVQVIKSINTSSPFRTTIERPETESVTLEFDIEGFKIPRAECVPVLIGKQLCIEYEIALPRTVELRLVTSDRKPYFDTGVTMSVNDVCKKLLFPDGDGIISVIPSQKGPVAFYTSVLGSVPTRIEDFLNGANVVLRPHKTFLHLYTEKGILPPSSNFKLEAAAPYSSKLKLKTPVPYEVLHSSQRSLLLAVPPVQVKIDCFGRPISEVTLRSGNNDVNISPFIQAFGVLRINPKNAAGGKYKIVLLSSKNEIVREGVFDDSILQLHLPEGQYMFVLSIDSVQLNRDVEIRANEVSRMNALLTAANTLNSAIIWINPVPKLGASNDPLRAIVTPYPKEFGFPINASLNSDHRTKIVLGSRIRSIRVEARDKSLYFKVINHESINLDMEEKKE